MKEAPTPQYAAVADLRIGMFIHLEGGWLAHPFPLSNFKLNSAQQIATLRSLGLTSVRWSPAKSDLEARTGACVVPDSSASAAEDRALGTPAGPSSLAETATRRAQPIETPEPAARRERRLALAAQREAMHHCQRQFAEASSACKTLTGLVPTQPQIAREASETLTRAFADKMVSHGETCIRLLGEVAGDKAAAHLVNVTVISLLLGRSFGLAEAELFDLGVGAMLHDIGKLSLPERLRHCEDHFTPSESLVYQEHVAHGVAHARRMGLAAGARKIIEQHHECADGSGFPLRLGSDRMTVGARIVALVNRYDNLCNPNVPSRALTPHEALALLFAQGKSKFDATILGGFVKMMGVYPPGSVIQLTDERYALVVAVNASRPLKPRVLVHDRLVAPDEALLIDLEAAPRLGIRRSVKPHALPRDALDYLSPRPRVAYFFEPARELETEATG